MDAKTAKAIIDEVCRFLRPVGLGLVLGLGGLGCGDNGRAVPLEDGGIVSTMDGEPLPLGADAYGVPDVLPPYGDLYGITNDIMPMGGDAYGVPDVLPPHGDLYGIIDMPPAGDAYGVPDVLPPAGDLYGIQDGEPFPEDLGVAKG
jgi:hypothetical protein